MLGIPLQSEPIGVVDEAVQGGVGEPAVPVLDFLMSAHVNHVAGLPASSLLSPQTEPI